MGAGKSTLAALKASEHSAILISEDDWLSQLYAGQVKTVADYKLYSDKLKPVVFELVQQILSSGVSVMLDFPANTQGQRKWLQSISDGINAEHVCYWVDRTDDVCIQQLLKRGNPHTDTIEMFHAMAQYFTEPCDSERLNITSA